MDRKFHEAFARNFQLATPSASETEAKIKESLVQLLRQTNRAIQADEMDVEVADIRRKIVAREKRIANDRRNFLEMITEEKREET